MRKLISAALLLVAPASAQQFTVDQVDQALALARVVAANEITVKEQRIAGLLAEVDRLKKAAAECKPEKESKK